MHMARLLLLTALGLLFLAPVAGGQDLIERRPQDQYNIEPRGVSLDQAVQMAQRRYHARAVKAETLTQGDRRVHRIRLMSSEGKVWHVQVDARTGAIN
jgi:uncharacterized membrane protein YkoI